MAHLTSNLHRNLTGLNTQSGGSFSTQNLMEILHDKKTFMGKVFATLISQLAVTYGVMEYYPAGNPSQAHFIAMFISQLVLILVLAMVPMPMYVKLLLFTGFSVLSGITLSYMKESTPPEIIHTALIGTLAIFVTMFMVGLGLLASGVKMGAGMALFLLISLLAVIIAGIVMMFMGSYSAHSKTLSGISLFLFSLYIIYDTNSIMQRSYAGDYVTASMDYYLDILNVFVEIIGYKS